MICATSLDSWLQNGNGAHEDSSLSAVSDAIFYSFGPNYKIDPAHDFTALTLEAITLCAMSYR